MFDALASDDFDQQCRPAFQAEVPRTSCCNPGEDYVPYLSSNLDDETIALPGDASLTRWNDSTWTDPRGTVHGPDRYVTVTLRVGRVITHAEFMVASVDGRALTIDDVKIAAIHMGLRARSAQDGTPY